MMHLSPTSTNRSLDVNATAKPQQEKPMQTHLERNVTISKLA